MDLSEIGLEVVVWIRLAQRRDFANTAMNLRFREVLLASEEGLCSVELG
jgi:hypothetical protein